LKKEEGRNSGNTEPIKRRPPGISKKKNERKDRGERGKEESVFEGGATKTNIEKFTWAQGREVYLESLPCSRQEGARNEKGIGVNKT